MSDTSHAPVDRPFTTDRYDRVPVYRWWRQSVVGTVDHEAVVHRIVDEGRLSARYVFMTMMSAGIAMLGLLLSSPAVVIGAMLISPLMGPILGLGFALALFDFTELRRSLGAFLIGSVVAVLFTAAIVLVSPLKEVTAEILARTRPNLFDLLVALFAALAGSFAIIRGRGDTIVGVAIATALMPPLAVVGYGLATWNVPVLTGSLALFGTNFLTIALAATIMARIYGFGHFLSRQQTWLQTVLLLLVFVAMGVPLGVSLERIASQAITVNRLRTALSARFGPNARVTQLDVQFDRTPWAVRAVVIAPRDKATSQSDLRKVLQQELGRPLSLQVDEILLDPAKGVDAERAALEQASVAEKSDDTGRDIASAVAVAAGVKVEKVTVDRDNQRVLAAAAPLAGAGLASYRALEGRAAAAAEGWTVQIVPPLSSFPAITFQGQSDALDASGRDAVLLAAWAARRWNVATLSVPGLPAAEPVSKRLPLIARRALAIAAVLHEQGIATVPAPSSGGAFRLTADASPPEH